MNIRNIRCRMFPCSDWATTHILENIPDSLGDIGRVKSQQIIVRNGKKGCTFIALENQSQNITFTH